MEQTLNALVEKRIASKLTHGKENADQAYTRLQAEGKIARDFPFEVGTRRKGTESNITFSPDPFNKVAATFRIPDPGTRSYRVNQHAVKQVAEKLSIPGVYLTSLLAGEEWQRTLAYSIMNTHNGWTDRNKVLVRAVGDEVRAFLSVQYRRLDSEKIFKAHVDQVNLAGAVLSDGFMDDTRISIESLFPEPIELRTELNGTILLAFGTRLSTSDYGDGALELRSFILQGVCLNGMVRESVLHERHLGARLPDSLILSQETYESDSKTQALAVRDYTKNLYDNETIRSRMLEVQVEAGTRIDAARELKNLTGKLLKGETEEIGKILMRNNPEDGVQGEASLWKLSQGITAYANRDDVVARRKLELQEIAGNLFTGIKK